MEAIGQLTGGVAHDFNNILTVIGGNAERLDEETGGQSRSVKAIARAAERGAKLTRQLLAFSRQQPMQTQAVDLGQLARGMLDVLRPTLGASIELEIKAVPDLWPAMADAGQLENAILNLAINARDAMPRGGKMTIDCANRSVEKSPSQAQLDLEAGDYVVLAVSDSGKGMTKEVQEKAFDPFFTTKALGEGSGLGLSMVYGLAKQLSGHADLTSDLDQGTTVRLYLPRADAIAESEVPVQGPDLEPRTGQGESVLVIEDDEDVRALVVRNLKDLNYEVTEAGDTQEARRLIECGPALDLVLSDVVLPGGQNGLELAEDMRQAHPELRFVFMSGYPAEADRDQGPDLTGIVLLNKPFSRDTLARTLREILDRD